MALIHENGITISKLTALSPNGLGIQVTDKDGAKFFIYNDVIAHIVSVMSHTMGVKDLRNFMDKLCSCEFNGE
jgi:hypothetical protein